MGKVNLNGQRGKLIDPETRFWLQVRKKPGCWTWLGCLNKDGYGVIRVNGERPSAHRYSWMIHFGEIPEGIQVLHHCDNPSCVRPDHLFLGTIQDNVDDCMRKGRDKSAPGESNYGAVLTEEQVLEIRRRYKPKCKKNGGKALGKLFGVDAEQIYRICSGKSWRHI